MNGKKGGSRNTALKARLYLGRIAQEKIGSAKFGKPDMDNGIVICCDGLCCVLDFSKFVDPGDIAKRRQNNKWMLREEPFGGLLWNTQSDHVFELNHDAYSIMKAMASGKSVEDVSEEYHVAESDIYSLFSQVTKTYR